MRKYLWSLLLMGMPLTGVAQNTWSTPKAKSEATKPEAEPVASPDQKYLEGAVPEEDGRVVFRKTFAAPGKTAFDIYNILGRFLEEQTHEKEQLNSRIVVADTTRYEVGASYEEWLVFKANALSLDRTRFYYVLKAECKNGSADVEMSRIKYLYEEGRNPQHLKAEGWITDKDALNKKKTKLTPITGKFRRKTIDRKDVIFKKIEELLK